MSIRSIETNGRKVRIAIAESLAPADLRLICDALKRGGRGRSVQVDFRGAREITPAQLLSLTCILTSLGVSYGFSGLSSRNLRPLDCLPAAPTGG